MSIFRQKIHLYNIPFFLLIIKYMLFLKLILLLSILISFLTLSYIRNISWFTEITLWEDVVNKSPNKSRGWDNLGASYIEIGEGEKGARLIEKSIEMNPYEPLAYNNLANYYMGKGDYDTAISLFL